MPIILAEMAASGTAQALSAQAEADLMAVLAAAGWVLAAGIAWWYGPDKPPASVDYSYTLDPDDSWACFDHPFGSCYGPRWGCLYGEQT